MPPFAQGPFKITHIYFSGVSMENNWRKNGVNVNKCEHRNSNAVDAMDATVRCFRIREIDDMPGNLQK